MLLLKAFFILFCPAFILFMPGAVQAGASESAGVWDFLKGEPADDAVLIGLFSHHTSGSVRESTHNLIGLDYRGYSFGTLKNSHSIQTYYAGLGRKLYERKLGKNASFDVMYRFFIMYGYAEQYPDIFGLVPAIIPMFGFNLNYFGVDFMVIPAGKPVFAVSFRIPLF